MVPGNEGPGGREVLGFNPVFDTGGPDIFALPAEDVSVFLHRLLVEYHGC